MSAVKSNNNQIKDKTMELIAQRVAEFKKNKEASQFNDDEVESHVGALSEVFDLNKDDVKSIANDVLTKQEQQESIKDKILDGLIKYGKELIIACITVIIASLFIIGKSNVGMSSTASEMGGFGNSAMTSTKFKKNIAIAEVMNVLGPLRMELTEYYYNERKFPKTLKQLGFNVNDFKKSKNIENIMIDTSGSIIVKLKNSIEKDVIFKFSPQTMMGAIEWSCFTNFSGSLPFCEKKSLTTDLKALTKN